MRRPSLLHHYKNKKTLQAEVLQKMFEEQYTALDAIDQQSFSTIDQMLEALDDHFVEYTLENPHYLRILMHKMASDIDPGSLFVSLSERSTAIWKKALNQKAIETGARQTDLYDILALLSGSMAFLSAVHAADRFPTIDSLALDPARELMHRLVKANLVI